MKGRRSRAREVTIHVSDLIVSASASASAVMSDLKSLVTATSELQEKLLNAVRRIEQQGKVKLMLIARLNRPTGCLIHI